MGIKDAWRDFNRTPAQAQADELRERCAGGDDLRALADRHPAMVYGSVRTVTLPPRTSVPVLVAELWDGSGSVDLVWIGRRRIGGVRPGALLRARGRVATVRGRRVIFNPAYELVPA